MYETPKTTFKIDRVERPKGIYIVISLYCFLMVQGLIAIGVSGSYKKMDLYGGIAVVLVYSVNVFLLYKISQAKNWARVTFFVLLIPDIYSHFNLAIVFQERYQLLSAIKLSMGIVTVIILILLVSKPMSRYVSGRG